jgi:hypothetical protein
MTLHDRHLRYAQLLVAGGRLPRADAGRRVVLELAPAGHSWRGVSTARVHSDGVYRVRATARSSGRVRVLLRAPARTRAGGAAATDVPPRASRAQGLTVVARLAARTRHVDVLSGHRATVAGVLLPRRRGRIVRLEVARHGRWRTLALARTSGRGHFAAHLRAGRVGSSPLRVRFSGDRVNAGAAVRAGRLQVFRSAGASWYQLTGNHLACGGTMGPNTLGVANKTLPCGTPVTFRYRGRSVRVRVIDRGPYVGGRDWDLSGATARRLHFGGVGRVWSTA